MSAARPSPLRRGRRPAKPVEPVRRLPPEPWEEEQRATLDQIDEAFIAIALEHEQERESLAPRLRLILEELGNLLREVRHPWTPKLVERVTGTLARTLKLAGEILSRRMHGGYHTDAFGFDQEYAILAQPFLDFLFESWWRVEVRGLDNFVARGPAMYVANHSGLFPWDALMLRHAIQRAQDAEFPVRALVNPNHFKVPFFGVLLSRIGLVPNYCENVRTILHQGESVVVFPGGDAALARSFSDSYRVPPFDDCGYVETAMAEGVPIIPVSIIGAHESYPIVARLDGIGRMIGLPMFPVTPFFPFAPPPLWPVPLPVKWMMSVMPSLPRPTCARREDVDMATVHAAEDDLHHLIQVEVKELLHSRKELFG